MRKRAICRKAQRRHSHFYQRCAHWSLSPLHAEAEPIRWHRERWMLAGTALLITVLSGLLMPAWASAMRPAPVPPARTLLPLALPKLPPPTVDRASFEAWHTVRVQPGQTLSDIFQAQGLSLVDLHQVIQATGDPEPLRMIQPGEAFDFLLGRGGSLEGFRFDKDETTRTVVRLDGDAPVVSQEQRELNVREHVAHGVIDDSLFGAAAKAGMSDAMVVKLADIFKYDIDFIKDIRSGDSFTVIYNDVYRDGAFLHEGDIVAAEFINQGKRYTAYRFKQADGNVGWFSEDGRPLRKSLMRTPVAFTRISSRFSLARKHPILGYTRAHQGVDYAAPKGTPIHAAGDGTIVYRGWERGYGNFVLIRHNGTYSTAYGHMSGFAKGERVGTHVRQGEVIGYVGMTGLATGPHLHYEVRINGKAVNPLTVTMPKPQPLPAAQLAKFEASVVKPQLARLKMLDTRYRLAHAGATGGAHDE
jgi:murein DD-endopeptidase MepM/ murein hydrolase activator NlpD